MDRSQQLKALRCWTVSLAMLGMVACTLHAQDMVTQNSPCSGQPRTRVALRRAFNAGHVPSWSELTGSWVAIGFFGRAAIRAPELVSLNCNGLKRDTKFEEVLFFSGSTLEAHIIGTSDQRPRLTLNASELTFPFDFGGDANPVFRCRFSARGTLVCLIEVYRQGVEFKRMTVKAEEVHSQPNRF